MSAGSSVAETGISCPGHIPEYVFIWKKPAAGKLLAAGFLRCVLHFVYKRLAVGTLYLGRIGFVGSYLDFSQGTVILSLRMVSAVIYGTANAFIFVACHNEPPFSV